MAVNKLFLAFVFLLFGVAFVSSIDVDMNDVIDGVLSEEELDACFVSTDVQEFINSLHQEIAYDPEKAQKALNDNQELRKRWLGHYGIEDNGGVLSMIVPDEDSFGSVDFFVTVEGDEANTSFSPEGLSIQSINKDGSVILDNGASFLGSQLYVDSETGRTVSFLGEVDLSAINRDVESTFLITGQTKIMFNKQEFDFSDTKGHLSPGGKKESLHDLKIDIGKGNILFEGLFDDTTNSYRIGGKMNIDSEDTIFYSGHFMDLNEYDNQHDEILIGSGDDFFQYLKNEEQPVPTSNYVRNVNGDLFVSANSLKSDESVFTIHNAGGISQATFEKMTGSGEIHYVTETAVLVQFRDGFSSFGEISALGEVHIIDPRTHDFESPDAIAGSVLTRDKLVKGREIAVAKTLIQESKALDDPLLILVSNEHYEGEERNLKGPHNSAERLKSFMVEHVDISENQVYELKDKDFDSLTQELEKIIADNKDAPIIFSYGGHGIRDSKSDDYFLSATDAEPKRDEKGNILNALSAEYLNSLGVDIAIVDSCYADGVCKDLNSRYIIASSRSDQVSFGATDIDSTTPGYQEGSLFSAMLFDDQRQLGDTPTGFITLLDETIINGIDGWLTHVYSPVKGGGNIQTPVVRNNKISGSSLIRFKYE